MIKNKWNPDQELLAQIRREFKKISTEFPLMKWPTQDSRYLNASQVVQEIESGTEFGRLIYYAYMDDNHEQ